MPLAGEAGWLPNANGFDGAVAEVGVTPKAKGAEEGWPNVDGLAGCELRADDGWPNPPVVVMFGALKAKGEVAAVGVLAA